MIKRFKSSLTAKIFLTTVFMLVIICVLTYGFIAWMMPMTYRSSLNSQLSVKVEQFIVQLQKSTLPDCQPLLDQFAHTAGVDVYIQDMNNHPLKSSADAGAASSENLSTADGFSVVAGAGEPPKQWTGQVQVSSDKTSISSAVSYPIQFLSDENKYLLLVIMKTEMVNQATEVLWQIFPLLILAVLGFSLLGALYYSRFITRPIVKVSGIAGRMSKLEFDWKCEENRSDEIGLLEQSLNELAKKLAAALADLSTANLLLQKDIDRERELERQRLEFFSAVSHELKTPITILKGQLEGMLGNVGAYKDHETYLEKCLSVARVMEGLVQEILTVTRMDSSGFAPQEKPLDLTVLVKKQLDVYHELMEQKYITLETDLTPGLEITGDGKLLQKAISNLLSNAVRYSPAEERIYVRTILEKDAAVLTVENTGVSIPEESISHLFEAFYRVEQSRNRQTGGSGLGLYLVSRIAKLHGAQCRVENSERGVKALLTFPLNAFTLKRG